MISAVLFLLKPGCDVHQRWNIPFLLLPQFNTCDRVGAEAADGGKLAF